MDTIMNMLEQKRNINAFNSYYLICDLCGGYHTIHTCRQTQNVDYYGEFGHYNSCFDQYGPNRGNLYAYGLDNQCIYSDSPCFYDYPPECVQYEPKPS